jgi:hypothetical protein
MKKQEIVAQYRATVSVSYERGSAYVLQGACQSYDLMLASGLTPTEYAQTINDSGADAFASVKQNLSHIKWAMETLATSSGEDIDDIDVMSVVLNWKTMGALRAERYPKSDEVAPKKVAKASKAFNAKAKAKEIKKELSRKEIAELIAELIA